MVRNLTISDDGRPAIAAIDAAGTNYLQVRVWPADDGFNYIPCADIAALYETMKRAPNGVSGIGVKLMHEPLPFDQSFISPALPASPAALNESAGGN